MKKSYKNLGLALLCVAVVATVEAKKDNKKAYVPKSPWPLAPVEDAVVGTAGVLTLGQTDADPSALPMTIPDAIPGVSYARGKDEDKKCCDKNMKKKSSKKQDKKKEKKQSAKKKKRSDDKKVAEEVFAPVILPAAMASDVVTLDTQHNTRKFVNSVDGDKKKSMKKKKSSDSK